MSLKYSLYLLNAVLCMFFLCSNSNSQELENFVLFGQESVRIDRDTLISSGNIGSNGQVIVDRNSHIKANIFGDNVFLSKETIVSGNITSNQLIKEKNAVVQGEEENSLTIPILTLPSISEFSTGSRELIIPKNSSLTIDAGDFASIKIDKGSEVIFLGGIYNTQILRIGRDVKISFNAPTTVNIQHEFTVGRNSSLSGLVGASEVNLNYIGTYPIEIGRDSLLHARVLAPDAMIIIDSIGDYRGSFVGREILVVTRPLNFGH